MRGIRGLLIVIFLIVLGHAKAQQLLHFDKVADHVALQMRKLKVENGKLYSITQKAIMPGKSYLSIDQKVTLPTPSGNTEEFVLSPLDILPQSLKMRYPEIQVFKGKSLQNPGLTVYLNGWNGTYHMQFMEGKKSFYLDPLKPGGDMYVLYEAKDALAPNDFACYAREGSTISAKSTTYFVGKAATATQFLHQYRIAIATTGEYAAYQATYYNATDTVAAALNGVVTTLTRVTGIYENELAITFQLVANEDQVIFTNPQTDPYTNGDANQMLDENQSTLDAIIGSANYDIGHVFGVGSGGIAQLGCVCSTSKAKGVTGSNNPVGDAFDVDYVAHEMGHQFGATHTFNGTLGACSGSNRTPETAVEPGSGSTIMAYAGICSSDDLQRHSDPYFQAVSLDQITAFINDPNYGGSCATVTSTSNHFPTINLPASGFTIPYRTPFQLNGAATDQDGDPLTYCWEEMDLGDASAPDNAFSNGPIFRSFLPTSDSFRIFPRLDSLVHNTTPKGSVLPAIARDMIFRLTVRDNASGAGSFVADSMMLHITDNAGPFEVTSPNESTSYYGGQMLTVRWNTANTQLSPVNCQNVSIALSTDGGLTYPTVLAAQTANDGEASLQLPNVSTTQARIKISAIGNIFFDISDQDFTITHVSQPDFYLDVNNFSSRLCALTPESATIRVGSLLGYSQNVSLSAFLKVNNAQFSASFSQNPVAAGNIVTATFTQVDTLLYGLDTLVIEGADGSTTKSLTIPVKLINTLPGAPTPIQPDSGAADVSSVPTLVWGVLGGEALYQLQISQDSLFQQNVLIYDSLKSASIDLRKYAPLQDETRYFWRVKAFNSCFESAYSKVRSFSTIGLYCNTWTSDTSDHPVIAPDRVDSVKSSITVDKVLNVYDLKVHVKGVHTFVSDLIFKLTSPSGRSIILRNGACGDANDFDITFDDNAAGSFCPLTGIQTPDEPESTFRGTNAKGTWTLTIYDTFAQDGGQLLSWDISICTKKKPEAPILSELLLDQQSIILNWVDKSQYESGFYIQRSLDSLSGFQTIDSVAADSIRYKDNTGEVLNKYYYRVLAYTPFGQSAPSNVLGIKLNVPKGEEALVAPNPTHDFISIYLNAYIQSPKVKVYAVKGAFMGEFTPVDGKVTLDVRHWEPGLYVVHILGHQVNASYKFVKY